MYSIYVQISTRYLHICSRETASRGFSQISSDGREKRRTRNLDLMRGGHATAKLLSSGTVACGNHMGSATR